MFLGIVLSYHGEPSLTLAVNACRILLIPACLIPNLIPACTLHPTPQLPLPPITLQTLFFPFTLYPGIPPFPSSYSLALHPTLRPIVTLSPYTHHSFSDFTLHPVCPFHLCYHFLLSFQRIHYPCHLFISPLPFFRHPTKPTLSTLINTYYTPKTSRNWF